MTPVSLSRRDFLSAALLAPAAFGLQSGARLIGTVALAGEIHIDEV